MSSFKHTVPRGPPQKTRRESVPTLLPSMSGRLSMAAKWQSLEDEGGRPLTRFTRKREPIPNLYRICQETSQLLIRKKSSKKYVVIIELNEVREIRLGQNTKDFQKWPEELSHHPPKLCFTLFYGNEFVLKTFSVAAPNNNEFTKWYEALTFLVKDATTAPSPTMTTRWLKKEFFRMESKSHLISIKDIKTWYTKIGLKPSGKFKELCQDMELTLNHLNFKQFSKLYHQVVYISPGPGDTQSQQTVFQDYLSPLVSESGMSFKEFQSFLIYEQGESFANDHVKVEEYMKSYLDGEGPLKFTQKQFMDYLYSKHNQVCQLSERRIVTNDMNQPLSHYWISSSHNTYLTGDQITSDSSCESYIRCLRSGCKCIELDCWDGDKEPIIYHGRTLTSKIYFKDVLEVIKVHAWDVSDYPLILSLENHCSIPQQQMMADSFKKIFGDMLLKEPIKGNPNYLPSPMELKRKIILKNKKLKPGSDNMVLNEMAEDDISQNRTAGLLLIRDPVDQFWKPHYFVLTAKYLVFTDEMEMPDANGGEAEEETEDEQWFHDRGREYCVQLLERFAPELGDGAFLVRPTTKDPGYSLSFWRRGTVNHCRIAMVVLDGVVKYSLSSMVPFNNLKELIQYYQTHNIHCEGFTQMLGRPVTANRSFARREWYHESLVRDAAIEMLAKIPYDGAFLVRRRDVKSEEGFDTYSISFRAEAKIQHCTFEKNSDGYYMLKNALFESIEELVGYYRKTPLYRNMKLRYPTNNDLIAKVGQESEESIYAGKYYVNPADFTSDVFAKALYDYEASSNTELSFRKGNIVRNINKVSEDSWWRGDTENQRQGLFPASYVQEQVAESSLGSLLRGQMSLNDCSVVTLRKTDERFPYRFRVTSLDGTSLEVACTNGSEEHCLAEAKLWTEAIRENVNKLKMQAQVNHNINEFAKKERLARELSNLIVYCQTVGEFEPSKRGPPEEMSSLSEARAEKYSSPKYAKAMNIYNQRQFSRIYPKGTRIDSSNYDPTAMWSVGCQLVALNFQTPDIPMQLNHGKFLANGGCGYVRKPDYMCRTDFDPYSHQTFQEPLSIAITILSARNLPIRGRDIPSGYVEIDIYGCQSDSQFNKSTTGFRNANGLNPVWMESCVFDIINPDIALIRFVLYDRDMFADANFLGQATYPVKSLRNGYRSVPIKNGYSEEIPLSSLLIHIHIGNPKEDYQDIYMTIQNLQEDQSNLVARIDELQATGNRQEADRLRSKLASMKRHLDAKKAERQHMIGEKKPRKSLGKAPFK